MSSCWTRIDVVLLEKNIWLWKMSSCWRRIYFYSYSYSYSCCCSCVYFIFIFLVLVLFLCCWCCLKLFCVPSGLPQAPFFPGKMTFLKKWYFLKCEKTIFCQKMLKNTTFELLDHHHELNQKKLILLKLFMLKIDSTMLKLWSIPFFSCIFWPCSTPCTFLNV